MYSVQDDLHLSFKPLHLSHNGCLLEGGRGEGGEGGGAIRK